MNKIPLETTGYAQKFPSPSLGSLKLETILNELESAATKANLPFSPKVYIIPSAYVNDPFPTPFALYISLPVFISMQNQPLFKSPLL